MGEPINETGVNGDGLIIRGKHLIILDDLKNSTEHHRLLGEALMLKPQQVFVRAEGTYKDWTNHYISHVSSYVCTLNLYCIYTLLDVCIVYFGLLPSACMSKRVIVVILSVSLSVML